MISPMATNGKRFLAPRLTLDERKKIESYLKEGKYPAWIARALSRARSTVYREIKINIVNGTYDAITAHHNFIKFLGVAHHSNKKVFFEKSICEKILELRKCGFSLRYIEKEVGINRDRISRWLYNEHPESKILNIDELNSVNEKILSLDGKIEPIDDQMTIVFDIIQDLKRRIEKLENKNG